MISRRCWSPSPPVFPGRAVPVKLEDVYEEVFSLEKEQIDLLQEDLLAKLSCAEKDVSGVEGEDQDLLQLFFLHRPHEL